MRTYACWKKRESDAKITLLFLFEAVGTLWYSWVVKHAFWLNSEVGETRKGIKGAEDQVELEKQFRKGGGFPSRRIGKEALDYNIYKWRERRKRLKNTAYGSRSLFRQHWWATGQLPSNALLMVFTSVYTRRRRRDEGCFTFFCFCSQGDNGKGVWLFIYWTYFDTEIGTTLFLSKRTSLDFMNYS